VNTITIIVIRIVRRAVCWSGAGCWQSDEPSLVGAVDRFDDTREPGPVWDRVMGGRLGTGCGPVGTGTALYLDGPGIRQARTVPLDLRHIKSEPFTFMLLPSVTQYKNFCRW